MSYTTNPPFKLGSTWYTVEVARPSQHDTLMATCGYSTEASINDSVWLVHWGEDGPGYTLVTNRQFFLADQQAPAATSSQFQDWYWNEWADLEYVAWLDEPTHCTVDCAFEAWLEHARDLHEADDQFNVYSSKEFT